MKHDVNYDPKNVEVEIGLLRPGESTVYHRGNFAKYGDKQMRKLVDSFFNEGKITYKQSCQVYYEPVRKDDHPTTIERRYYTYYAEKLPEPYKPQKHLYDRMMCKTKHG